MEEYILDYAQSLQDILASMDARVEGEQEYFGDEAL